MMDRTFDSIAGDGTATEGNPARVRSGADVPAGPFRSAILLILVLQACSSPGSEPLGCSSS
jgi:hypothetical protein